MRKTAATSLVLALIATMPSTWAASKTPAKVDPWSIKQRIVYIALTPADDPTFWQGVVDDPATEETETGYLDFAKVTVANAMDFWKKTSNDRMKFDAPLFYVGKAGTAQKHCASNTDIKTGMKIAGLKTIPKGTRLVVANINDTCGYAGLGAQAGNSLNLKSLSSGTLIHELGHNFGFLHSAAVYCKENLYSKFTSANCEVGEYDDFRDLMGNDEYCPSSTLSATQRATVFGTPIAKDVKIGTVYSVDESRVNSANIVYQLKVNNNWYFFEYYSPDKRSCMWVTNNSRTPEIQVRILGPSWIINSGRSVGPTLITRLGEEPAPVAAPEGIEYAPQGKLSLNGFKKGEKFKLPLTNYYLNVISTETTTAQFSITTS